VSGERGGAGGGTPIVAGRDFTWSETYERLPVAIVSKSLARDLSGRRATLA
jgi:hypothetical protein